MPDSDSLLQLFESTKALYSDLRSEMENDERYVTGDYGDTFLPDDWDDEGLQAIITSTAYDAVENAANHILTTPHISVPARPMKDSKEAAEELAERFRIFLDLWWRRVEEDQGDPFGKGRKHIIKGRLILKKTINWELLPDPPPADADRRDRDQWRRAVERVGREHFIWNYQLVPPLTVYEDLETPWNPAYGFDETTVLAQSCARMFPDDADLAAKDPTSEVQLIEYYSRPNRDDPGKHCIWIEHELKLDQDNPYSWIDPDGNWSGYVPYFIADPDWGWNTTANMEPRPEDRYVGLLRPLRTMITAKDRQLTAMESWLRMHVWPLILTTGMDNEDEDPLEFGPGKQKDLKEGQTINYAAAGEAPLTVLQFVGRMIDDLDRSTKFGALGGMAQRGVDTATEADNNMRNAATKLSGPVNAMRRIVMRTNQTILQDIEHVFEVPVTVYAATATDVSEVTIKPSEIKGYHHTFVELTTSDERAIQARDARLWSDLFRSLPISAKTAMVQAGIPNPQEEMDERAVENTTNAPQMQMARLMMALTGMGEVGQMLAANAMREVQGGAGVPPPPQPTEGDAAMLTSVDGLGNPAAAAVTEGRMNALQDQRAAAFR